MDEPTRGLTQEAFEMLLSRLHPDREEAGAEYSLLRSRLIHYFENRDCPVPDELAFETIRRVANKLLSGTEIQKLQSYSFGIARKVRLEYYKDPDHHHASLEELAHDPVISLDQFANLERKELMDCFKNCLRSLPPEDALLLIEYWYHDDLPNRTARKVMTEKYDISPSALRTRIHRIKLKFETCFQKCGGEGPKIMK